MDDKDVVKEFIALIYSRPDRLLRTKIKSEYLRKPYSYLFDDLLSVYQKHGLIDTAFMPKSKYYDDMLLGECLLEDIPDIDEYFLKCENAVIEIYKKSESRRLLAMYANGHMDFYKARNSINELAETGEAVGEALTEDAIDKWLSHKTRQIEIKIMPELSSKMMINENDVVVLSGMSGFGKTALALNIMNDLSDRYSCVYINIELSENEFIQRLICINTGISMFKLNSKKFNDNEKRKINDFKNKLKSMNIKVFHGSQTIESIQQIVGSLPQDKHHIVFIDHIGRISVPAGDRYTAMTRYAIMLRNMTLDYNCTIFELCQLSRESIKSEFPSMSLLRDSGEIEQSARKVAMIWNYNDKASKKLGIVPGLYISVLKGPLKANIQITEDGEFQKFEEV